MRAHRVVRPRRADLVGWAAGEQLGEVLAGGTASRRRSRWGAPRPSKAPEIARVIAAVVSWLRGPNMVHPSQSVVWEAEEEGIAVVAEDAMTGAGVASPGAMMEPDVSLETGMGVAPR